MTAEKLFEILSFLESLDERLGLQTALEAVKTALANIVSNPAAPQHQSALASALSTFEAAVDKLQGSISPSQYSAIKAMGGEEFFDPSLSTKIKTLVQTNAMTPSVANDFVQDLSRRRATFLQTIGAAHQNLEKLNIREVALQAGSADLSFLIPREIFDNHLEPFAKELTFISRMLQDFGEALTGDVQPVELEQLSSSVPTVALAASIKVIGALADIVNKFLEAWRKVEEIRELRERLLKIGMKGTATDELDERITTTIEEVVEESTELVVANYQGNADRKNELSNAIRQETARLFGQIERGLTIEFRAAPKNDGDAENNKILEKIATLGSQMQFPSNAQEPMLLGSGDVIEGDVRSVKHSKRTVTHKTTTTSKKPGPASD